jgi:hypothetical protein
MKKILISIVFACQIIVAFAANPEYQQVMFTNIRSIDTSKNYQSYTAIGGAFEQIASAEPMEWLPLYYAAFCYTLATYNTQDADKRDMLADCSLELADNALKLRPSESELYTLMAFAYIAKLNVNPMVRGMVYMSKVNDFLDKAKELNPSNPRPYYLKATMTYYSPEFVGGGREKALPQLNEAFNKFNAYNVSDSLMPKWGKEHCLQLINEK